MLEEDDEFTHDGGEGDFLGLADFDQPIIEGFEDRVEAGRDHRSHVEHPARTRAACTKPTARPAAHSASNKSRSYPPRGSQMTCTGCGSFSRP